MPDVKQKLAAVGFVPIGDTPEEFAAYLKAESEKWGKVIRDGKISCNEESKMKVLRALIASFARHRSSRRRQATPRRPIPASP